MVDFSKKLQLFNEETAEKYKLIIAEDACEALGSTYRNKQLGTFGEVGTFSSFFSHHITTMEVDTHTNSRPCLIQPRCTAR